MFEVAKLGHRTRKKDYQAQIPSLQTELRVIQQSLLRADFPTGVLLAGPSVLA